MANSGLWLISALQMGKMDNTFNLKWQTYDLLTILPGMDVYWMSLHIYATSSEVHIVLMLLNIYTVLGHCRIQELSPLFWSLTFVPCHLNLGLPRVL